MPSQAQRLAFLQRAVADGMLNQFEYERLQYRPASAHRVVRKPAPPSRCSCSSPTIEHLVSCIVILVELLVREQQQQHDGRKGQSRLESTGSSLQTSSESEADNDVSETPFHDKAGHGGCDANVHELKGKSCQLESLADFLQWQKVDLKKLATPACHAPRARQIGHACCPQQHRAPNSVPSSGADTAQYQTPEDGTNTPTRRQAPLPNQKYVAAAEKYGNVRARPHGRIERGIDNRKQPSAEHNGQHARQLHVKARARVR